MSIKKKHIRKQFRKNVLSRDRYTCVCCGAKPLIELLDPHHITDRNDMPNGGYVPENGITLCGDCHIKAEAFHNEKTPEPGFSPNELYERIGSSLQIAIAAATKSLR